MAAVPLGLLYDVHGETLAASRERNPGFGDTVARRIEAARFGV
jgi:hypothetical protein